MSFASPRRHLIATVAAAIAITGTLAYAQRIWVGGGGGFGFGVRREPPKWAKRSNFDGSFNYCRGFYSSDRREDGGMGWWTDYPGADNNFSVRLAELTFVRVRLDQTGQPDNVVVQLTDSMLTHCPILFMEDVGTMRLSDDEVQHLRNYLLKAGSLYATTSWAPRPGNRWVTRSAPCRPPKKNPS